MKVFSIAEPDPPRKVIYRLHVEIENPIGGSDVLRQLEAHISNLSIGDGLCKVSVLKMLRE